MRQLEDTADQTPDSVARVLEAGEAAFAALGFDGASMKAIATSAKVSQSLLHYHFGTKEALYRAVIERRAKAINAERQRMLDEIDPTDPNVVTQIFRALFTPPLGPKGGGLAFARIFAGMIGGGQREAALIREFYDDTASRFISALEQAAPGVTRLQATKAYTMSLGLLAVALQGYERVTRLAGQDAPPQDDDLLDELIRFAVGGFDALRH